MYNFRKKSLDTIPRQSEHAMKSNQKLGNRDHAWMPGTKAIHSGRNFMHTFQHLLRSKNDTRCSTLNLILFQTVRQVSLLIIYHNCHAESERKRMSQCSRRFLYPNFKVCEHKTTDAVSGERQP
jgi:hypothetical protein